jgi:hypothetical protein
LDQQSANNGDTPNKHETPTAKKTQGTFLQGCLGCFGVIVLAGIVAVAAYAMIGDKENNSKPNPPTKTIITETAANSAEEQARLKITKAVGVETNMGETKYGATRCQDSFFRFLRCEILHKVCSVALQCSLEHER